MSEELVSEVAIHGTEETGLDIECAWNVGKALAEWLPTHGWVAVMYVPSRHHIAEAVIEGLRLQGRDVVKGGGDRSAIMTYQKAKDFAGAVIVNTEGKETTLELFDNNAARIDGAAGLNEIRTLVEAGNFVPAAIKGLNKVNL